MWKSIIFCSIYVRSTKTKDHSAGFMSLMTKHQLLDTLVEFKFNKGV